MSTRIRTGVAATILGLTVAVMTTTPVPFRACVFVKELERSSSGPNRVSLLERVLYSLIEANNRGVQSHAPGSV